jgi:hypothetical protein
MSASSRVEFDPAPALARRKRPGAHRDRPAEPDTRLLPAITAPAKAAQPIGPGRRQPARARRLGPHDPTRGRRDHRRGCASRHQYACLRSILSGIVRPSVASDFTVPYERAGDRTRS